MNDLTLIIPAKKKLSHFNLLKRNRKNKCKKLIVLQKEIKTKKSIENIKNIEICEQSKNGYGSALIEGINSVKTEYCCIINADGSMDPKYLEDMKKQCTNQDFVLAQDIKNQAGGR